MRRDGCQHGKDEKHDDTHYDDFGWTVDEPYVQGEGLGFDENYLDSDRGCSGKFKEASSSRQ